MRRGPSNIPLDNIDRTIEYLEGGPGYENVLKRLHFGLRIQNALTYIFRPVHFRDVEDFDAHKYDLADGEGVAFDQQLEVLSYENIPTDTFGPRCILKLGDDTGNLRLIYPYQIQVYEGMKFPPHPFNDPIYGADIKDRVQVYQSTYKNGDIEVIAPYFLRNDDHYSRVKEERSK